MEWIDILEKVFEICIVPILGVLVTVIVSFIEAKKEQMLLRTEDETLEKYITMLSDLITDCVIATNQTYVEALKGQELFDEEAQKQALELTYQAVMGLLSETAVKILGEAFTDLEGYIRYKIEAEVNKNKGTN